MAPEFSALFDILDIQEITDAFCAITGVPSFIVSLEGKVIVDSGRQEICILYPEAHRDVSNFCHEKKALLYQRPLRSGRYSVHRCPLGFMYAGVPISMKGRHAADFYAGRFFHQSPDKILVERFKERARRFGYEERAYLHAVRSIPVISEKHLDSIMEFLSLFGRLVGEMGQEHEQLVETLKALRGTENKFRGLTERMKEQLRQAQRMQSIGTLAGGIAHDFNNILSPIMIHAEMAMMDANAEDSLGRSLQQIYRAAERAKELVDQILTFSRKHEQRFSRLKLVPVIKETLKFVRSTVPTTIEVRQDLRVENDVVFANLEQIHQMLINLFTNAAQSMEQSGGMLQVELGEVDLDAAFCGEYVELIPGRYLALSICDNGKGMDENTQKRIFEPYFTTRKVGQGSGMGLAVVHGIVKSHRGEIVVDSRLGEGTTFRIYLPLIETPSESSDAQPPLLRGKERILFVDDEKDIIDAYRSMLEMLGYQVTALDSSEEALRIILNEAHRYDLLITDMTMPRLTGIDLARHAKNARPGLPVILCTGFSELVDGEKAERIGVDAYIEKPISMRQMAGKIRDVLKDYGYEAGGGGQDMKIYTERDDGS